MRHSIEPRERRYFDGYGFPSFAKKCETKLLDQRKKSGTEAAKNALKRVIQKTAEVTGNKSDLIGNNNCW